MTPRTVCRTYDIVGRDVPRDLFPAQRVKISLATANVKEAEKRRATLRELRTWSAWDVLYAIHMKALHVAEVQRRVKAKGEQALTEIRRELEAANIGTVPTFREEADRYLAWYATQRRARSLRQIRSRLKRFGEQSTNGIARMEWLSIDEVTKADIEAALTAIGGASGTREAIRLAVSGLYRWSVTDEAERARAAKKLPRWSVNPAGKVARGERHVRVVTAAESQMLALLAASEPYQEAYVRCYAQFGLRRNELIHTRLHDDLDVRDWVWRIQERGPDERCRCLDCRSDGWQPKTPKRSRRTLLVPEGHPIRTAIERYLALYPCEPGGFVFRNPRTGRVWEESRIEDDFKTLCERAGLRYGIKGGGLTLHCLRHTCATDMIRAGVRESVVAAQLGDDVKTVVDTYLHLKPSDLADGVARGPRYL